MNLIAWTEERVEALKKLWDAGLSASQCAAELGAEPFRSLPHVSRNAVIGKLFRLGLTGKRVKGPTAPRKGATRSAGGSVRMRSRGRNLTSGGSSTRAAAALALAPEDLEADVEVVSDFDNVIPFNQRLSLQDLTSTNCHWPIGDPQSPDFYFCGGRALVGRPYCAHHTRISIQPAKERRHRGGME